MNETEKRLSDFYSAFQARDAEAMIAHYHENVEFSDPIYPSLDKRRVSAMWRMLCKNATDLQLEFDQVEADDAGGRVRWIASYTFSDTQRWVNRNTVIATFQFQDGLIVHHQDDFDLKAWAKMALGFKGRVLILFGLLNKVVRKKARAKLDEHL